MSVTLTSASEKSGRRMARIRARKLAEPGQRPRIHPAQLHPLRRRRCLPARRDRAHARHVGDAAAAARQGTREGHPRRLADSVRHSRARARLHRQGARDHRRAADRRAAEARDHAVRRLARGRGEPRVLRLQAGRASRRNLHQVPQDAQRRRIRRLHAGHQECAVVGHRDRPAGCVRPRPHHRRLSPGGALRRRLPHRRQGAREAGAGRPPFDRGRDPPARGAVRADPVAQGAEGDGVALRLRHLRAGHQRPRGRAVDLLRLSRRHQAAERRGDVGRAPVHVLGHLLRARPSRRHADRVAGAGDHRRPRHQVAHRALPARAGVQRALLRRPGVGDGGGGRDGRGRPHARHQERVSHAAHPQQPRTGARAQPHGVLVAATARGLQALRDQDVDRYQRDPVRVRRSHAAQSRATTAPSPAASRRCGSASRCSSSARG